MVNFDEEITGWHQVQDVSELEEGKVFFVDWRSMNPRFMYLLKHEVDEDLPFPEEYLHFVDSLEEDAFHIRLNVDAYDFTVYAPDDPEVDKSNKDYIRITEVADILIQIYIDECMKVAKENWCDSQVEMLERLLECVRKGCEYKCVGCTYLSRPFTAPEDAPEVCMWDSYEDKGCEKPCESDV